MSDIFWGVFLGTLAAGGFAFVGGFGWGLARAYFIQRKLTKIFATRNASCCECCGVALGPEGHREACVFYVQPDPGA